MAETFTIRRARLGDLEEIAAIHAGGDTDGPLYDQRITLWSNVLGGGPRRAQVWVALKSSGEILGFVSAGKCRVLKDTYDGEIIALYIAKDSRRCGVGRRLVSESLSWMKAQGFRSAMAWVSESDEAAIRFFQQTHAELRPEKRATTSPEVAVAWLKL